jgi:cell division protein FtsB
MTAKKKTKAKSKAVVKTEPKAEGIFTRRRVATAIAAVLALLMFYAVVFGKNGVVSYAEKRHESAVLAKKILELQAENALLKDKTERLATDPDAIEHQAIEDMHYTKPGAVIYTLRDEKK